MHRKSTLLAAALALAGGAVSAQTIQFTPQDAVTLTQLFNPDGGVFAAGTFTQGQRGVFTAGGDGAFQLTYLGQESAFSDRIRIEVDSNQLTEFNQVGDTIMGPMVAGGVPLSFEFVGGLGFVVPNGTVFTDVNPSFALLGTDVQTDIGTFAYVLGFNDAANHDDWDDFVVGLNTAPIPEPQTYALLLAGLGVVGFVARRRKGG
jgi:PEP-CTERM motif-containing protein